MTRLLTTAAAIATFGLGLTLGALPAAAQEDSLGAGDEKVNQLIIYGDDPCPASASGEITVCARKAEAERYRIPERCAVSIRPSPMPGPTRSRLMKQWVLSAT